MVRRHVPHMVDKRIASKPLENITQISTIVNRCELSTRLAIIGGAGRFHYRQTLSATKVVRRREGRCNAASQKQIYLESRSRVGAVQSFVHVKFSADRNQSIMTQLLNPSINPYINISISQSTNQINAPTNQSNRPNQPTYHQAFIYQSAAISITPGAHVVNCVLLIDLPDVLDLKGG